MKTSPTNLNFNVWNVLGNIVAAGLAFAGVAILGFKAKLNLQDFWLRLGGGLYLASMLGFYLLDAFFRPRLRCPLCQRTSITTNAPAEGHVSCRCTDCGHSWTVAAEIE